MRIRVRKGRRSRPLKMRITWDENEEGEGHTSFSRGSSHYAITHKPDGWIATVSQTRGYKQLDRKKGRQERSLRQWVERKLTELEGAR